MKHYAISAKDDQLSIELTKQLHRALAAHGWTHTLDQPQLVIVIGGDGAMLRAIHNYIEQIDRISFVGVHTGTLGFYTDYEASEIDTLVNDIVTKTPIIEDQLLVEAPLHGDHPKTLIALNEIRFENPMHTMDVDVLIDDQFLEHFKGNGLAISTPSGSTAYNKSLGGAVLMPSIDALQLTEIAPIRHNKYASLQSSLVIPASHVISLVFKDWHGTVIGYDHLVCTLTNASQVTLQTSDHRVRFARYRSASYIKRLQKSFIFNS